jgi:nucleolar MIF4G domain-containing protein 1
VPPAARARAAAAAGSEPSAEVGRLTRALKGLLNRMGDANAQAITQEIADLPSVIGMPRRALCTALAREVTHALLHGPRASHSYSCALAACVAALSAAIGPDLGAVCMASAAFHLDTARGVGASEDGANAQGASNLAALLARLFVCGLAPAAVLWGLLHHVTGRLSELDVALTLNVLRCAGPKLRQEDPEQLRDFIIALQQRVRDSASRDGDGMTTRARVLLDLVCDIKNGKKGALHGSDEAQVPAHVTRWLRDAGVSIPAAQLCGLTLAKLLEGAGQPDSSTWWRKHDLLENEDDDNAGGDGRHKPGSRAERGQGGAGDDDTRRLLAAAAEQRMNTPARRAAFVALMGSDDVADAAERLLRLGLPPAAERDILRVVLHCCLGEAVYNPFYEHVTSRLCTAVKRHRVTLQYCVWDAWKAVCVPGDGAYDARQLSHLARFVAGTLLRGALPFSALRGADWSGAQTSGQVATDRAASGLASAHARRVAHLRLLLKALLLPPRTASDVHALFLRGAGRPQLVPLRAALLQFMRRHLLTDAACGDATLLAAVAAAEAGLNGEAAPMALPR